MTDFDPSNDQLDAPDTYDDLDRAFEEAAEAEKIKQIEAEAAALEEASKVPDPLGDLVFDEKYQRDFEGLLYLGDLRKDFVWAGHTFSVRTLTVDELLRIGLLTQKYEGSIGADRAYVTAVVAAAVEEVDGKPLVTPLGPETDILAEKFKYVRQNWYSWTTDAVYQEFRALEMRVQEILDAMGEASG